MMDDRRIWKLKRMGKGIILEEIAKYVGYSISMINKYENGLREMDDERVNLYKEYIENKLLV